MMPSLKIRSLLQLQELLEKNPDPHFLAQVKTDPAKTIRDIIELPTEDEYKKYKIQSVQQLKQMLEQEPRLIDLLKHDPVNFIQKTVKEPLQPQYKIYRILVSSLCIVVIIIIIGVLTAWLTKNSREAPTLITAVACTTLGILAGIFVSIPEKTHSQQLLRRFDEPDSR